MYFIYPWLHCCSILKCQAVPRFSRSIWGKWFVFCLTIALRKIIPYTMWIKGHCVVFSHALIKGIFHHHLQHKMGRIRTQQWVPQCWILLIFTIFIVLWVKNKSARSVMLNYRLKNNEFCSKIASNMREKQGFFNPINLCLWRILWNRILVTIFSIKYKLVWYIF